MGVNVLSRDERDKTFEYIYSKPYKRNEVITAKIIVGIFNILMMAFVTWICSIFTLVFIDGTAMGTINDKLVISLITITIVGMILTQLVFFSIGLLFAAVFKTHNAAMKFGFLYILLTYAISVVIAYVGNIEHLNFLTPFRYLMGIEIVNNGISIIYLLIGSVVISISVYLTYAIYNKKDLRY